MGKDHLIGFFCLQGAVHSECRYGRFGQTVPCKIICRNHRFPVRGIQYRLFYITLKPVTENVISRFIEGVVLIPQHGIHQKSAPDRLFLVGFIFHRIKDLCRSQLLGRRIVDQFNSLGDAQIPDAIGTGNSIGIGCGYQRF